MRYSFTQHWRLSVIAFSLSAALLAFHHLVGTPHGASFHYNLSWYEGFRNAFWAGDLYPRFVPDLWYGMGGADFYFYGPLPFWFTAIFGEATCPGCSTSQVFSISAAWMMILSGVTFFVFARRFFDPRWAFFGAILYVFLPVHYLLNWYVAQTIGTMLALVILPIFALATIQLNEERKSGLLFALCLAGLTLSHLPTTLIIIHVVALLVLGAAFLRTENWREGIRLVARFIPWATLGVALSAIYWVPAIMLLDTVSSNMLYSDYYDATNWLLLDGRPESDPSDTQRFKGSLILAVITSLGAGSLLYAKRDQSSLFLWIIVPALLAAFLMTILSYPVWKYWIINKVQFPYRTMVLADFSIALAMIVIGQHAVKAWPDKSAFKIRMIAIFSALALFAAYLSPLSKSVEITQSGWGQTDEFLPVAPPEYIPPAFMQLAFNRFRDRVTDDVNNQDRYILFFEEMQVGYADALVAFESDAPGATLLPQINERMQLQIDLPEAKTVRLPVASWTFWRAQLSDGTPLTLSENAELGILQIDLPAGRSEVELYLIKTPPQQIGSLISLIAILSLLGTIILRVRIKSPNKPLETSVA